MVGSAHKTFVYNSPKETIQGYITPCTLDIVNDKCFLYAQQNSDSTPLTTRAIYDGHIELMNFQGH